MGNSAMNGEYPDTDQRYAVCNSQWKRGFTKMHELEAEVFAVGTWNGLEFSKEDLNLIANAFSSLREYHQVPIKFGHNDEQPMTDGQPALGWVDNVWVNGNKLMAKFIDIPKVVYEAIQGKLYKNVSIELDMGVEHKGNHYPWVLSGVALLGADIPAVNVLADLQTYMGRDKGGMSFKKREYFTKKFASETHQEDFPMSDDVITLKEKIHTLEMRLSAKESENEKLVQENTDLKNDQIKMKAQFKATEEAERNRQIKDQRDTMATRLDGMVKDGKIAPFSRDEFLRDYDEAGNDDTRKSVVFAVEKLEKTIDSNPAYFGAEQARAKAERDRNEGEMSPDAVVTQRTREYMAKHGEKSFAVAKQAILRADTDLANRYTKMEG